MQNAGQLQDIYILLTYSILAIVEALRISLSVRCISYPMYWYIIEWILPSYATIILTAIPYTSRGLLSLCAVTAGTIWTLHVMESDTE